MEILRLEAVTKEFDGLRAVDNFSWVVPQGCIYGLLGPNGAGKTTTIRMILNIILPDKGTIEVFGGKMTEKEYARIGYLPEERGLYKKLKIREMLKFLAEIKGIDGSSVHNLIEEWLRRFDLYAYRDRKVEELSKGMQQKLQFISTVIHNPDLLILDEPFSGLDPVNTDLLKDIILEMKNQGKTIILSTHQMEQAERLCDNICMINKSKKVFDASLQEIKRKYSKNNIIIEFYGEPKFIDKCKHMIEKVNVYSNYAEIRLKDKNYASELLKEAISTVTVNRYEIAEPSLHDIFVEIVSEKTLPTQNVRSDL
jgi:ABC-2 type transport system ATP-binding protein